MKVQRTRVLSESARNISNHFKTYGVSLLPSITYYTCLRLVVFVHKVIKKEYLKN